jgi:adenylosuccinate synthase
VGAQWGDEGKGKLVDVLAERADWVVRYQGGANAGHTVHIGNDSFVLHQIPSGILLPGVRCAIGNGVVLDPVTLFTEIDELVKDGIDVEGRLYVSDRAHLVMTGDAAHERTGFYGLVDIVVGTHIEGCHFRILFRARRKEHNKSFLEFWDVPKKPARLHAIHFWHHDVEKDKIRDELACNINSFCSIERRLDFVSTFFQVILQELEDRLFIVNDKHFVHLLVSHR